MIAAVLTGDIVASSSMPPETLDRVRTLVTEVAGSLDGLGEQIVGGVPEFFRGDSWQLLLWKPEFLLRVAVIIRARLIATGEADSRIAVGVGPVGRVEERRVSLSSGEAFTLSGQALDAMKKSERLVLSISPDADEAAGFPEAVMRLFDVEMARWTARQAEIVGAALELPDRTQAQIAERLIPPVTPQAVGDALRSLSFDMIEAALLAFERGARKAWGQDGMKKTSE